MLVFTLVTYYSNMSTSSSTTYLSATIPTTSTTSPTRLLLTLSSAQPPATSSNCTFYSLKMLLMTILASIALGPQQREDQGRRRKKAKAPRQRHPHHSRGRETQSQTDLHQDNKLGIQKEHLVTLFEEISNKKREKIKCFCFLPGYLQWRITTWVKPKRRSL